MGNNYQYIDPDYKYTGKSGILRNLANIEDRKVLLADKEVTIMAPQGWIKKIKTDTQGNLSFDAGFAGIYIIEYGQNEEEAGNWNGSAYKETWQTVTTSIAVK